MFKFKWVIPSILAGGCHPLLNDEFDLTTKPDFYTGNGINLIISTFEVPISSDIRKIKDWDYYFAPTEDGTPPKQLEEVCSQIANGNGTFIHCLHGLGRTSTCMCAYLLFGGYVNSVKDAVLTLRKHYSGYAVHTPKQYVGLMDFAGEHKSEDELANDIEELFPKAHNYYSGRSTYEKLLELANNELPLIKDKFGENSPEYNRSKDKQKKAERALRVFDIRVP